MNYNQNDNFKKGNIHTGLLDQEYKNGYDYPKIKKEIIKNILIPVASLVGFILLKKENTQIIESKKTTNYILSLEKKKYKVQVKQSKKLTKINYKKKIYLTKSMWQPFNNLIDIKFRKLKY